MSTAGGSERPPADGDAVEQLQRAALTLIGAARVALDALEHLVADRERLEQMADRGRRLLDPRSPARPERSGQAREC